LTPVSRGDPAAQLERLPGVVAATLFLDTPALPRVYLATTSGSDHETLRQAVLGLLSDHGLGTDPDHVHIAAAPRPSSAGTTLARTTLDAVEVQRADSRAVCTVRLRAAGRLCTGEAAEPDTRSGRARAAARATLQAAESLDPDYRFGLEGIRVMDLFGHEALILLLDATAGRNQAFLPGAALVGRSLEEAAALAGLHALRDWIG
jgi:hypothetical protein